MSLDPTMPNNRFVAEIEVDIEGMWIPYKHHFSKIQLVGILLSAQEDHGQLSIGGPSLVQRIVYHDWKAL